MGCPLTSFIFLELAFVVCGRCRAGRTLGCAPRGLSPRSLGVCVGSFGNLLPDAIRRASEPLPTNDIPACAALRARSLVHPRHGQCHVIGSKPYKVRVHEPAIFLQALELIRRLLRARHNGLWGIHKLC